MRHFVKVRIDRDDELILLTQVSSGETKERIMLIEADGGMGKSELLREFISRCHKNIPLVVIDFKNGGTSISDILMTICDTLEWKHFRILDEVLKHFTDTTPIDISRIFIVGKNRIDISMSGLDEQTRELRLATLTKMFFTDIRSMNQIILVFDTYDKCDPTVRVWLASTFLRYVHHSPGISVIIAGREVPESTIDWEYQYLPLTGIKAEHWYEYSQSVGITISRDWIYGCCDVIKGHPLQMALYIDGLA